MNRRDDNQSQRPFRALRTWLSGATHARPAHYGRVRNRAPLPWFPRAAPWQPRRAAD
jgi:hypothetical protein